MGLRKTAPQLPVSLRISSVWIVAFPKYVRAFKFSYLVLQKLNFAPRGVLLLVLTIFLSARCPVLHADNSAPLYEQKIKAGLVYNLIKYTEWPNTISPSDSDTKNAKNSNAAILKVCLFGEDPFDGYLSPLEGRTAQKATITITHVTQVQQTLDCSAVIIHRDQEQQLQSLLQFLNGKNVLTISDIVQFAERGGMVELTQQDEKIALRINKGTLDNAKLGVDGRMLKLAKIVVSEGASR
jgi:hypothetical protein